MLLWLLLVGVWGAAVGLLSPAQYVVLFRDSSWIHVRTQNSSRYVHKRCLVRVAEAGVGAAAAAAAVAAAAAAAAKVG